MSGADAAVTLRAMDEVFRPYSLEHQRPLPRGPRDRPAGDLARLNNPRCCGPTCSVIGRMSGRASQLHELAIGHQLMDEGRGFHLLLAAPGARGPIFGGYQESTATLDAFLERRPGPLR